jgi:hypothetical protein
MKKIALAIAAATMTAGIALSATSANAATPATAVKLAIPAIEVQPKANQGVVNVGYRYRYVYRCQWFTYGYSRYWRCAYVYVYYRT